MIRDYFAIKYLLEKHGSDIKDKEQIERINSWIDKLIMEESHD